MSQFNGNLINLMALFLGDRSVAEQVNSCSFSPSKLKKMKKLNLADNANFHAVKACENAGFSVELRRGLFFSLRIEKETAQAADFDFEALD